MVRQIVAGLVSLALLGVAGFLGWEMLQGPEDTPAPVVDQALSADEARELLAGSQRDAAIAGIETVDIDARIAADGGSEQLGPYVPTQPAEPGARQGDWLQIPGIHLDAPVDAQGISGNAMTLPGDLSRIGHLDTTAALDAEEGSTLLAGHVTYNGYHGAMYYLGLTAPGQEVVTWSGGEPTRWVITSVKMYSKQALPEDIYQPSGERQLVLVTCGGELLQLGGGYYTHAQNIVVKAVPVDGEQGGDDGDDDVVSAQG